MALQIVYNVLLTLSNTVLVAVSFFLVMATCKYFHFFVAFPFIVAPLAVVTLLPVNASIVQIAGIGAAAVTALALLMMVIEFVAIGPLRRRGATAMQLTLVSLVLLFVAQNTLGLFTSGRGWRFQFEVLRLGTAEVSSVSLSKHQLLGLAVAGVALVVVALGWRSSAVGIAFRAVQENSVTAQSFGIPVETWRSYSVGAACAMSGIAGIAHCFDNHMYPQSGFDSAFVGIACVVIGGRRHLWQPLLGAFVISLTKNLGAYWLPHNWEPTLTMGAMLITLLFSPEWRRPYVGQLG